MRPVNGLLQGRNQSCDILGGIYRFGRSLGELHGHNSTGSLTGSLQVIDFQAC